MSPEAIRGVVISTIGTVVMVVGIVLWQVMGSAVVGGILAVVGVAIDGAGIAVLLRHVRD